MTGLSAGIGGLSAGTEYGVQVRASNAEGDGQWSAPGSGDICFPAPGALGLGDSYPPDPLQRAGLGQLPDAAGLGHPGDERRGVPGPPGEEKKPDHQAATSNHNGNAARPRDNSK